MLFISGHFTGYCLRCRSPAMEDVLDQGGSGVVAFQGNDFEQAHPRPTAEAMLPQLQVFDATGVDVEQHGLEDVPQDYADGFFQVSPLTTAEEDVDQEELFAIGTKTSNPLRLRGGGAGKEDGDDTSAEEAPDKEPFPKESRRLEKKRNSSCIGRMETKEGRVKKTSVLRQGGQGESSSGDEENKSCTVEGFLLGADLSDEILHSPTTPSKPGVKVKRRSSSCEGRLEGCTFFHSTPLRPGAGQGLDVTFKDDTGLLKIIDLKMKKRRKTIGVEPAKVENLTAAACMSIGREGEKVDKSQNRRDEAGKRTDIVSKIYRFMIQ